MITNVYSYKKYITSIICKIVITCESSICKTKSNHIGIQDLYDTVSWNVPTGLPVNGLKTFEEMLGHVTPLSLPSFQHLFSKY